jgi:hypothetical protein
VTSRMIVTKVWLIAAALFFVAAMVWETLASW